MARTSKEKDSTYNKAYYDKLMTDPERRAERSRKSVMRRSEKNRLARVERWKQVVAEIHNLHNSLHTDEQIAEYLAQKYNTTKLKHPGKWMDFSPSSKSLSSLSSSATARPARTQGDASA